MKPQPRAQSQSELVSCDICKKEVPLSEAKNFEAEDYVAHFCGIECYSEWKHQSEPIEGQTRANGKL
jgi:hypothetical protein